MQEVAVVPTVTVPDISVPVMEGPVPQAETTGTELVVLKCPLSNNFKIPLFRLSVKNKVRPEVIPSPVADIRPTGEEVLTPKRPAAEIRILSAEFVKNIIALFWD